MEIIFIIGSLFVLIFISFFSEYNKRVEESAATGMKVCRNDPGDKPDTFDKFANKREILNYLSGIGIIDNEANILRPISNADIYLIRDKFPVSCEEIFEVISFGKMATISGNITNKPAKVKRKRVKTRDENGNKESELQYLNGVLDGPAFWWHPNGALRAQASFVRGELLEGYREWDEEGRSVNGAYEVAATYEESNAIRHETPPRVVESKKDAVSGYAAKSGGPDKIFYSKIAGVTYNNDDGVSRQQIIRKMKSGEKLTFTREPGNPYDSNAIAVYNKKGEKAGYIRKELARDMAGKIDSESSIYEGIVAEVTVGSDYGFSGSNYGVNIRIEERSCNAFTDESDVAESISDITHIRDYNCLKEIKKPNYIMDMMIKAIARGPVFFKENRRYDRPLPDVRISCVNCGTGYDRIAWDKCPRCGVKHYRSRKDGNDCWDNNCVYDLHGDYFQDTNYFRDEEPICYEDPQDLCAEGLEYGTFDEADSEWSG